MQPGDVYRTFADTRLFQKDYGYNPKTNLKLGVSNFIDWYKNYYRK